MMRHDPASPAASGTVGLADEPAVVDLVSSTILKLWGAVNDLTRLTR
jgi:hypothetical protein